MIIRYRIHTQHVAPNMVARHFDGFSIVRAQGFWKGKAEDAVIIEILGTVDDGPKVRTLASEIREQYRQHEVWITTEEVSLIRVTIDATLEGI